jgi:DNA-binding transcriptional MocR family regulator
VEVLDLAFTAERKSSVPMYLQLADHLRELIATGRLRPGEKLPATRELSAGLGIGRNTAALAYQTLIDDGALLAHVGQGTFVHSREAAGPRSRVPAETHRAFAWDGLFSSAAQTGAQPGPLPGTGKSIRFDFRGGRVDPEGLPIADLRRAYSRAITERLPGLANEFDPLGERGLREEVADALVSRGIGCNPSEILITSGAQQALDLVSRVLVDPGDYVAVEQPGYFGAFMSFRAAGARLIGIDVDREGLRTDALARALRSRRIKLVYTTPASQMPTGVVLSEARRRSLLELADETQTPILEDDYDSEFRYGKPPQQALKVRDAAGQVIYVGTFSKALFPGMRIGYVVAAPPLISRLAMARFSASFSADTLGQVVVADLLGSGGFERHMRRVRRRYSQRRTALLNALGDLMPGASSKSSPVLWTRPGGGLHVWLTLPADVDSQAVHRAAAESGLAYMRGEACYIDGRGRDQLALSFANQTPADLRKGTALLARLVSKHRVARRSA